MAETDLTPWPPAEWKRTPWGETCPNCGCEVLAPVCEVSEDCEECDGDGYRCYALDPACDCECESCMHADPCQECEGKGSRVVPGICDGDPALCSGCLTVWWWSYDEDLGAYLDADNPCTAPADQVQAIIAACQEPDHG